MWVTYCVLVLPSTKYRRTIFHAWLGPIRIPQKARWEKLNRTCFLATGQICGSCSAFWCVWGTKHRRTIFNAQLGLVRIPRKCSGTHYIELVFLHPVRYVGRETSTHYFSCSGAPDAVSTKGAPEHVMMNLCFRIPWDMRVTYFVLVQWCVQAAKCRHTIFLALLEPVRNARIARWETFD
jgi:hypothetical protein